MDHKRGTMATGSAAAAAAASTSAELIRLDRRPAINAHRLGIDYLAPSVTVERLERCCVEAGSCEGSWGPGRF